MAREERGFGCISRVSHLHPPPQHPNDNRKADVHDSLLVPFPKNANPPQSQIHIPVSKAAQLPDSHARTEEKLDNRLVADAEKAPSRITFPFAGLGVQPVQNPADLLASHHHGQPHRRLDPQLQASHRIAKPLAFPLKIVQEHITNLVGRYVCG